MKLKISQLLFAKMSSLGTHTSCQVFASFSVSLREYPCIRLSPPRRHGHYIDVKHFSEDAFDMDLEKKKNKPVSKLYLHSNKSTVHYKTLHQSDNF